MTSINPNDAAQTTARDVSNDLRLLRAEVTNVEAHTEGDNIVHVVTVEPYTDGPSEYTPATVDMYGDVAIPQEGTTVLVAWRQGDRPVVIGSIYGSQDDDELPEYEPGERIVACQASGASIAMRKDGTIRLDNDDGASVEIDDNETITLDNGSGTVELQSDGTVVINGGTQGAITDVSASVSTDSDGHVTSVSLDITRESSIQI